MPIINGVKREDSVPEETTLIRQVISEMDAGMRGKTVLYVDSAIARNIQHSLKRYQHEGHFGRCGNYMNRTN